MTTTTRAPIAPTPLAGWRFWVVPHTHWDREWVLPFEFYRWRLTRTLDQLIDVLEADPRFATFAFDGQAVAVEDYLEIRPDQRDRLSRLIAAGRIQIGPSYSQPDEFLAGQEALIRNLLIGRQVCRQFGEPMRVGYAPDTFGHVAQLPQILQGFGLDSLVFWRGLGDEGAELGAAFRWQAPDGSSVLAVRQLESYGSAAYLGWRSLDGKKLADFDVAAATAWLTRHLDRVQPDLARSKTREVLVGNGTDHATVQADLPDALVRLAQAAGAEARIASFAEYVDALRDAEKGEWAGELLGSRECAVVRGVNSTRMPLKQAAFRIVQALQAAETLSALATVAGSRLDSRAALTFAWKRYLQMLPHDSITGCGVDEVARDVLARADAAADLAERARREALAALAGREAAWSYNELPVGEIAPAERSVVNILPWARRLPMVIPLPPSLRRRRDVAVAVEGTPIAAQRLGPDTVVTVVEVPGFGAADLRPMRGAGGAAPDDACALDDRTIANAFYRVTVAGDGTVAITHLPTGTTRRGLHAVEDTGDRGDTYNYCPVDGEAGGRTLTPGPSPAHGRGETPGYALTPGPSPAHGRGETGERTLTPGPSPAERERGGERSERGEGAPRIRLLARGPVFAEIEIRRTLVLPGRVEQGRRVGIVRCPMVTRVRLWRQIDRVELETELVNRAEDHRLRVLFPAEPASTVLAESPFAVVRRPLQSPKPKLAWREPPCPTQHTGGAVAVGGLVLLTQGLPEYETWETADGTVLALTLLRCVGLISRDDMWTRPGHAGPPLEVPAAQCIGTHRFAYALQLGRPTPAALLRASQEYRTPGHLGDAGTAGRLNGRLTVEGSDLAWAALKPAEDGGGVVLRLYNPDDHEAATGEVLADGEIRRLALDESDQGPGDRRFALPAGRIGTWRIRPGRW